MSESRLLVVVGPTASGKTELALRLCEKLDGEVVSADSVQVYRHFDCGTGKPTPEERARATHHLVDILDPLETLDAVGWAARAEATLSAIHDRGKIPVVCGGSFLWVRGLLFGLAEAPAASAEIRHRHRELVERESRAALHAKLFESDPASAQRLNPNDFVRVSRALEDFELTGIPMSRWQEKHGFRNQRHTFELIGVHRERDELDRRIEARTGQMLASGWIDEVRDLVVRGYASARAMGSVGYRQVHEALGRGEWDLATLHESIIRATRVFVRRQRTWLREEPVRWVRPETFDVLLEALAGKRADFAT
jgi:tRNA dimethylallyltransferase